MLVFHKQDYNLFLNHEYFTLACSSHTHTSCKHLALE